MKKVLVLLAMVLGATNMYAQDYDLQRLADVCKNVYELGDFSDGLCFVISNGEYFIDKKGNKLFVLDKGLSTDSIRHFSDGLLCVVNDDWKCGYVDKSGRLVIPCTFDNANPFYKGVAHVVKDGRDYYIDKMGNRTYNIPKGVPTTNRTFYEMLYGNHSDVLSIECREGKYGVNNINGENIIPFIYDGITFNNEGLIKVEKSGKFGWLDEKGKEVIPIQFDTANNFSDGLAHVTLIGKGEGFVDKHGNTTFNPTLRKKMSQEADGSAIEVTEANTSKDNEVQSEKVIYGHKAVDLGLSVYWAECNIDASSIEDYGDYYSWGETYSKSTYSTNNYLYYENGSFENIGTDISKTSYDAAHVRWGSPWRMPTKEEFEELIRKCQWSWTTHNGVKGYKVQGTNGNSIFLPSAGQTRNSSRHWTGERGYYWTSTVGKTSRYAYYLVFAPFVGNGVLGTETDNGYDFRYWGYVIRPVLDRKR